MKISEVTIQDVKNYTKVDANDDDKLLDIILKSAKTYIKNFTGLNFLQLDTKEDLTIALLALCGDLYENRQLTVQDDKVNKIVKSILDMHCINLL